MRALRLYTPARFNARINVVCPWATDTQMLGHVKRAWEAAGLPMNQPEDVARIICELATGEQHNGRAVFVGGGGGYDIEKGINDLEPQWLGEEAARALNRGQQVLGMVSRRLQSASPDHAEQVLNRARTGVKVNCR